MISGQVLATAPGVTIIIFAVLVTGGTSAIFVQQTHHLKEARTGWIYYEQEEKL